MNVENNIQQGLSIVKRAGHGENKSIWGGAWRFVHQTGELGTGGALGWVHDYIIPIWIQSMDG